MRCEDLMKKNVECVTPQDNARTAAQKMRDANVGFLPVCDGQMKVLGAITDRDLAVRLLAEDKPSSTSIQDIMTRDIVSCNANAKLEECENLMAQHQKSRVICIDDSGKLVGVISLSDIAEHDSPNAPRIMREVSGREITAH